MYIAPLSPGLRGLERSILNPWTPPSLQTQRQFPQILGVMLSNILPSGKFISQKPIWNLTEDSTEASLAIKCVTLHDRSYSAKHSPWWEQPDNFDYHEYLFVKFGPMPHFISMSKASVLPELTYGLLSFPKFWCVKCTAVFFCGTTLPMNCSSLSLLFPMAAPTAGTFCILFYLLNIQNEDEMAKLLLMWNAAAMAGEYLDFYAQMWQWGQCSALAQPKRRCLLLKKGFLGPVHVATQPRPPGLLFHELRPAKGQLEIVSSYGICYCHSSLYVVAPVKQWPFPDWLLKKPTQNQCF